MGLSGPLARGALVAGNGTVIERERVQVIVSSSVTALDFRLLVTNCWSLFRDGPRFGAGIARQFCPRGFAPLWDGN
jgi:hypothetical protein